jgi:hypothetical protein
MDYIYQIENNIPSNEFFPLYLQNLHIRNESVLYAFVKGPFITDYDDPNQHELTPEWSLRGFNSQASSETHWGNPNNNWINWSYYYFTGPSNSKPLAESILYQRLNNLQESGQITDFRVRHNFIEC